MIQDIDASDWLNTAQALSLSELRGRVVVVSVFQMLCPGCVAHSIPQAKAIHETFSRQDVEVIGLHSVFEHHEAMTPAALKAFIHEYQVAFPVAIDRPQRQQAIPCTMEAWGLMGTPSILVFDRNGQMQINHFGHINDLRLGAFLGQLIQLREQADAQAA